MYTIQSHVCRVFLRLTSCNSPLELSNIGNAVSLDSGGAHDNSIIWYKWLNVRYITFSNIVELFFFNKKMVASIPLICHIWYTNVFFRPVKSPPKSAQICDRNGLATKQRKSMFNIVCWGVKFTYLFQEHQLLFEISYLVFCLVYLVFWFAYLVFGWLTCCFGWHTRMCDWCTWCFDWHTLYTGWRTWCFRWRTCCVGWCISLLGWHTWCLCHWNVVFVTWDGAIWDGTYCIVHMD